MTKLIPIFPLQLVIFPGERVNLHIFEPRYRELIRDCEMHGITFGVPAFIDGEIKTIGTELQLSKVHQVYDDGKMDVTVEGLRLFKITQFHETIADKLYSGAETVPFDLVYDQNGAYQAELYQKVSLLFELLNIDKEVPPIHQISSFDLAHLIGLSLEQEYELLTTPQETDRQRILIDHIEKVVPVAKRMDSIRKRASMNGQFRHFDQLEF